MFYCHCACVLFLNFPINIEDNSFPHRFPNITFNTVVTGEILCSAVTGNVDIFFIQYTFTHYSNNSNHLLTLRSFIVNSDRSNRHIRAYVEHLVNLIQIYEKAALNEN